MDHPRAGAVLGEVPIETPSISADGSKFFFTFATAGAENVFVMDRTDKGWSEPRDVGSRVNSSSFDGGASAAASGNLYFTSNRDGRFGIYRARWLGTDYSTAERLDAVFDRYRTGELRIAPDQRFILFNVHQPDDTFHLYVSVRRKDGGWSEPRNLGPKVNFASYQGRPCLSPDGRYLFYTSGDTKTWIMRQYQVDLASLDLGEAGTPAASGRRD